MFVIIITIIVIIPIIIIIMTMTITITIMIVITPTTVMQCTIVSLRADQGKASQPQDNCCLCVTKPHSSICDCDCSFKIDSQLQNWSVYKYEVCVFTQFKNNEIKSVF